MPALADQPGADEPGRQRRPRHRRQAGHHHHPHRPPRRRRVDRRGRHRQRHRAGAPVAHLRSVFYHQADRQGHRSGPVAGLRHRAKAPGPHRHRHRARARHHLSHLLADPPERTSAGRRPMSEMASYSLLFVDDEPNILSSLRRLFRPLGYTIYTAESGAAGLQLLEQETVDLVVSDMRMPEMDGARFLEQVRARWPDTVRLLLTGYSDVASILAAINRGEIYRYVTKPWDDNDILLLVKHALERRALELEKNRLEALTREQNAALTALNQSLEAKVAERTAELSASRDTIIEANKKLKSNFITTIKIFSSMIEMRGGNLAGHSRRVADLARQLAVKLDMPAPQTQEVFIAALLLDIGKIGFSDDLLALPLSLITGDKLGVFRKHPLRAEQLLMPLEDLRGAATVLRAHMERWDGSGFPDAIAGDLIPLGARILALASDYDSLQHGAWCSGACCRPMPGRSSTTAPASATIRPWWPRSAPCSMASPSSGCATWPRWRPTWCRAWCSRATWSRPRG